MQQKDRNGSKKRKSPEDSFGLFQSPKACKKKQKYDMTNKRARYPNGFCNGRCARKRGAIQTGQPVIPAAKGLTKDCISQIGSFLDGWTVIDYNERNDGIPSKTFKSEDTCMMNRGALELAAGREV